MEKDTSRFQLRIARDFLFDQVVFPLGATYPLPDIPVKAQNQVVFTDRTGKILLNPFQYDTAYQLKEETGEGTGAAPVTDGETLVLETDTLTKDRDDYTYNVRAVKNKSKLEKQLLRAVTLRVGVDVNIIPIVQTPVIDFGSTVDILLPDTQNGGTYQVMGTDEKTELSKPYTSGEGGDLMITTYAIQEDTPFIIRVMKTKTPNLSDYIRWKEGNPEMVIHTFADTKLTPVLVDVETGIDYNTIAQIGLENAQESVDYQLVYADIDDDTVDKTTFLQSLSGKSVKGKEAGLVLKSDKLKEDPTLVIRMTKRESGIAIDLPVSVFVPVKPDPDRKLSVVETTVRKGEIATIQVSKPQRGIYYQLVDAATQKEVGWRVYYHKNYGVGKARVEIEFAIDEKEDDTVFLATGPLDKNTTFAVIAKKATTGKMVGMTGTVDVTLSE